MGLAASDWRSLPSSAPAAAEASETEQEREASEETGLLARNAADAATVSTSAPPPRLEDPRRCLSVAAAREAPAQSAAATAGKGRIEEFLEQTRPSIACAPAESAATAAEAGTEGKALGLATTPSASLRAATARQGAREGKEEEGEELELQRRRRRGSDASAAAESAAAAAASS